MLVQCRCGQEFTVHEMRFPHHVSCHMCGVKLAVHPDGRTEEIRAISINLNCRCGRPFAVSALQFPRKIHCIDCNRRFSVLDTGEIIDAELESDEAAMLGSTAIQVKGLSEWKAPPITAVQEVSKSESTFRYREDNGKTSERSHPSHERHDERFARQLAAYDANWEQHRQTYMVYFFRWLRFYPTRLIWLGLVAAFIPISTLAVMLFFGMFNVPASAAWWILLIFVNGSFYFFCHLFQRASLYDAAEKRWQRERDAMIREHEAEPRGHYDISPIDSDDSAD
jgi:DNA-directed RNA polymerase subunit RPC12/RpoP